MFHVEHCREGFVNKVHFDIIVIGGGHAGFEAAWSASEFNLDIALISMPGVPLASTPCNPSVGGVGKGQVVRELDALGGAMGILTDLAGIQYRTLNESKGSAVQSTRVQVDKTKYSSFAEELIKTRNNIEVIRDIVTKISRDQNIFNIKTKSGEYSSQKVIITTGTFLNGKLHTGPVQAEGGRVDCASSVGLADLFSSVKTLGLRFKTGTPPRLKIDTINFESLEIQDSDPSTRNFHILNDPTQRNLRQISCYLTRTNEKTLKIIRENKEKSPMYNGQIKGIGPRYCPSIEDKAFRYVDRNIHHIFIEPEGLELDTVYPSGLSTSLPKEVQEDFIRTIPGLEKAEIAIYGYAVEYDVVDTSYLDRTLEYRDIVGLYFAGQINGTSGYEEAAGQGLIAGINSALSVLKRDPLILERENSYIGVMIDDLVTSTRDEPYRLFTARSENRLFLREDNTLMRMAKHRLSLGLNNELDRFFNLFLEEYNWLSDLCEKTIYNTSDINSLAKFKKLNYGPLNVNITLSELLKRPNLDPVIVLENETKDFGIDFLDDVVKSVAIEKKYSGYLVRASEESGKLAKLHQKKIDWAKIVNSKNVSFECRLRIEKIRPETFGQLKKIEGIRPATLVYVAGNLI